MSMRIKGFKIMERLTIKNESIDKSYVEMDSLEMSFRHPPIYSTNCYTGKAIDKLSELEDVLEKYGIESVEELEMLLSANTLTLLKKLKHQLAVKDKALELCESHHICFEKATLPEQVGWRETRIKENIAYFEELAEKELKE